MNPRKTLALLLPSALAGWALLAWLGERSLRLGLEERALQPTPREAELERRADDAQDRIRRLEAQLLEAMRQRRQTQDSVEELAERILGPRREAQPEPEPTAEELRALSVEVEANLALVRRLNEVFRDQGGGWIRFLSLEGVDGEELLSVLLSRHGSDGLYEGAYLCERLGLELDRAEGRLTLRLGPGKRFLGSHKLPLEDGTTLDFECREPRLVEQLLGDVVAATGEYPAEPVREPSVPGEVVVRALWKDKLDDFLEAVEDGGSRLRVQSIGDVGQKRFADVQVLGYTDKGLLDRRIEARTFEVWADEDTGRVELRFTDGFYEDSAGRVDFPERTYRMPVEGIDRATAERMLSGWVWRFRSGPPKQPPPEEGPRERR